MLKKIVSISAVVFCSTISASGFELEEDSLIQETDFVCDEIFLSMIENQVPFKCFSQQERDRIWMELHFCIKKMRIYLERADREAAKILDIDTENAVRAAISGAIGGLATKSAYGMAISTCLSTLGSIAGDAYGHVRLCRIYVSEAKYFAFRADELQEQLWENH